MFEHLVQMRAHADNNQQGRYWLISVFTRYVNPSLFTGR